MELLRAVARRHRCEVWSVVMLAAGCGPTGWRGCVPVQEYVPSRQELAAVERRQGGNDMWGLGYG